jgi:Glycosyl hydrolase family 26
LYRKTRVLRSRPVPESWLSTRVSSKRCVPIAIAILIGCPLAVVALTAAPTSANAATYYLRPNAVEGSGGMMWEVVGASTAWEAVDDGVTESETPSSSDYITTTKSNWRDVFQLGTHSISGVSVTSAAVWYYTATTGEVKVKAAGASQTTSTVGWHSMSVTVSSQAALDGFAITVEAGANPIAKRQLLATFLKIETSGPKVYWGAWMDGEVYEETNPGLSDAPWDSTTWNLFESHAGKHVSIVHFGQPPPWDAPSSEFNTEPLELTRKSGSIPMMDMSNGWLAGKERRYDETWAEEEENRVSLAEIAAGDYDEQFGEWARGAAEYGYPFFFRFDWEMNGDWFNWGRQATASRETFVKAWRDLHEVAVEEGAKNITWVWCPNVGYSTYLKEMYPGDEYVDWTCLDGYNRGGSSFKEIFSESYEAIAKTGGIAPSKPVMIGETATVDSFKASWIGSALSSLPTTFPKIKAFVWFNWNIPEEPEEGVHVHAQWPIESGAGAQAAFAEGISTPYFAEDEFGSPEKLKPIAALP